MSHVQGLPHCSWHQFSKVQEISSQTSTMVWNTQICCNNTHTPFSRQPSIILNLFTWVPNLAEGISLQVFTEKFLLKVVFYRLQQQALTCLTVLNSNLKEEILLKIQPRGVNLLKIFPILNTVILASTIIFLKKDTNLPIWGRDLQSTESKYICLGLCLCLQMGWKYMCQ